MKRVKTELDEVIDGYMKTLPKRKSNYNYQGITYDQNGKFDCKAGIHKFDEVWAVDSHYLHCDECELMIHIAKVDKTYSKEYWKNRKKEDKEIDKLLKGNRLNLKGVNIHVQKP